MHRTVTGTLAFAGVCGVLAAAEPARADQIYTYNGLPTYQGANGYPAVGTTITLDLTDAAVQSGAFNLSGYGTLGSPDYTGDIAGLVSLTTPAPFTATPSGVSGGGVFSVSFTFDTAGNIASDTVQYAGLDGDGLVSGNQALTSGAIGSDALGCDSDYTSGVCTVSGSWTRTNGSITTVPEPASFVLLGIGVLGLVEARRRLT